MVRLEDRGRAGDLVARLRVGVRRQPRRLARLVVVREHDRRPRRRRRIAPRASGWRRRSPRRPSAVRISSKSKTRWRGALSFGRQRRIAGEQLADGHPLGERIDEGAELREEAGQLGPVLVVEVDLAVVRAPPAEATRVGEQLLVLEERVEDVEPEAVDAALEPAADHRRASPRARPGCASSRRAARAGTCACRTGRGPRPTSTPSRRRTTSSCSASRRARTGRVTPSRHRYQSPYGPDGSRRDSSNQRWAELVWFITRSSMIRMPRRCASATRRSKSARVPKTGSIAS